MMNYSTKLFKNKKIRIIWDEGNFKWWYSSTDALFALTDSKNPRVYWNAIKRRNPELNRYCEQLKLLAEDGKKYLSDAIDEEGVKKLCLILSSNNSGEFLNWLNTHDEPKKVDKSQYSAFGISIGGTKTAVTHAFFDGKFNQIAKKTFKTYPNDPDKEMENIFGLIEEFGYPVDVISLATGGPQDIQRGLLLKPPHLPGFDNYPIVDVLRDRYHSDVYFLNDADACALAEYKFGAGRGYKNMAHLTFGTGIGSGLILNGQLFTGNNGMAGEIGHVRLSDNGPVGYDRVGSVEGYVAGGNIPLWTKDFIIDKNTNLNNYKVLTTKDIAIEARNGDKVALDIFNEVANRLGETISILLDLLNLELVVIGGIYPRCLDLLEDKVKESVKKNSINYKVCKIVPSELKEEIDDYSSLVGIMLGEDMKTFYERYSKMESQKDNIEHSINILESCFKNNGKILVCGNGGSSSDSAHIVGELMKSFMAKRPLNNEIADKINKEFDKEVSDKLQTAIPCIDLTSQTALLTAFANDVDPDFIFAQQVLGYSKNNPHDVLLAISASGNSKNVVNAVKVAKSIGIRTISLTGSADSELSKLSTVCIRAPETETYKVQEYHLPIYHYICMELEKRL